MSATAKSKAHEAIYARQRNTQASDLVMGMAWHDFGSTDVRAASPDDAQQRAIIDRVVDFCLTRKIKNIPDIYIIHSAVPNAASLDGKSLVFTSKIMEIMAPEELDAIIGHELSHHRHRLRDFVAQGSLAAGGFSAGQHLWLMATSALTKRGLPPLLGSLLNSEYITHGAGYLASMSALMPYRHFMEFESDKEGAQLTSPRQMISALNTLENHGSEYVAEHAAPEDWKRRITRTLLFPFSSHPSTERRVAKLEKMESRGSFADRIRSEEGLETAASR